MTTPTVRLSIQARAFAAEDPGPGGWQPLLAQCRAADAAGIDRIVTSDHIAFGENLDAYGDPSKGGSDGGKQPTGPDGHWLEPLTFLSVVAGQTSHARLMTGVLLAALRRPAVLAKTLATMDVLSEGRIDLGVGVGWQAEEYTAAGLPFAGRGGLLDHTLDVCQTLWTQQSATHSSQHLAFENIHAMPKPTDGGVPIWVSGRINTARGVNQNVLSRIVRFGSGWIPWGADALDPGPALATIRGALEDAGRDPAGFETTATLPIVRDDAGEMLVDQTMAGVPALVEAGITDLRAYVAIPTDYDEAVETLTPFVERFRETVGRS